MGCPPRRWRESREGTIDPSPEMFLLFDLKMEHFGAVFKLDLTEETRTQFQEEEAIASSCLILATPVYGKQRPQKRFVFRP